MEQGEMAVVPKENKYPYCIVWTPIPLLTWLVPLIGHMGICTSSGVIRDFGGSYYVGKDRMSFGNPTKFWQLTPDKVDDQASWDQAVHHAADIYQTRIHNLCCDNCHSMVALALNKMRYEGKTSWNMINLCLLMFIHGRYVSFGGFVKSNLPFVILVVALLCIFILY